MFPEFTVATPTSERTGGVIGTVSRIEHGAETWVGDNWVGYLFSGTTLIPGRWHDRAGSWEFRPDRADEVDHVQGHHTWAVLDGYWGMRAELVIDRNRRWRRLMFESRDAVEQSTPGGRILRPSGKAEALGENVLKGGWDHEHCAICWDKIGHGGEPDGYVDETGEWVCAGCYTHYVSPGSLAFIPGA
jgi:hypothetical protein